MVTTCLLLKDGLLIGTLFISFILFDFVGSEKEKKKVIKTAVIRSNRASLSFTPSVSVALLCKVLKQRCCCWSLL